METADVQKIPREFKQTEIGMIPVDWDVVQLGNVIGVYRGGSPRPIQQYIAKGSEGINWIKIGDVGVGAKYIDETEEKIIPEGAKRSRRVGAGDFLLSNSMSFGRPYILNIEGCIHDGWLVLQGYQRSFNRDFLYYILSSQGVLDQYISKASGSSVLNLNKELVSSVFLTRPELLEQSAIATILSDTDALISKLEALIQKKKLIKQGAMQELLTGKRRLPGFSGDWKKKTLSQVLKIKHGKSQKNVVTVNGKYPILASGGEIGRADEYLYNRPSVLIGRKGTIDVPQYMNKPFWTVDTLFYTEINEENVEKFIFYKFQLIDWYLYNEASGVPSLNAKTIERIETDFPPNKSEQASIVSILSDLDVEIEKLESQLTKYQNLKQGMMQALLTGKIRLI